MSLFSWLLPRKTPVLSLEQQERLLQLPPSPGLGETSLRSQRWVVVDLETSGLNLNRDQVLSIGAMFWETCWGHSTLNCDLDNTVSRYKQLANALQNDNNTLRARIAYLERVSDFGAANQPLLADNNTRIVTRY